MPSSDIILYLGYIASINYNAVGVEWYNSGAGGSCIGIRL